MRKNKERKKELVEIKEKRERKEKGKRKRKDFSAFRRLKLGGLSIKVGTHSAIYV